MDQWQFAVELIDDLSGASKTAMNARVYAALHPNEGAPPVWVPPPPYEEDPNDPIEQPMMMAMSYSMRGAMNLAGMTMGVTTAAGGTPAGPDTVLQNNFVKYDQMGRMVRVVDDRYKVLFEYDENGNRRSSIRIRKAWGRSRSSKWLLQRVLVLVFLMALRFRTLEISKLNNDVAISLMFEWE
jgi:hypothetical protein